MKNTNFNQQTVIKPSIGFYNDPRNAVNSKTHNLSSFNNKLIVGQNGPIPCGIPERATFKNKLQVRVLWGNKKSQPEG